MLGHTLLPHLLCLQIPLLLAPAHSQNLETFNPHPRTGPSPPYYGIPAHNSRPICAAPSTTTAVMQRDGDHYKTCIGSFLVILPLHHHVGFSPSDLPEKCLHCCAILSLLRRRPSSIGRKQHRAKIIEHSTPPNRLSSCRDVHLYCR